jgi:hypothetical protein
MAPILVATLAGASSNSYITVADATTYFDNRLDASDWTAATADNKAAALITATSWLDTVEFYGDRSATTQALKWPRTDVTCDGVEATASFIPREIKDATCEAALALLRNPTMLRGIVTAPGSYDEVELGELRVKYRGQGEVESLQSITDALPWLRSFLKCWAKGVTGPSPIRLYRS